MQLAFTDTSHESQLGVICWIFWNAIFSDLRQVCHSLHEYRRVVGRFHDPIILAMGNYGDIVVWLWYLKERVSTNPGSSWQVACTTTRTEWHSSRERMKQAVELGASNWFVVIVIVPTHSLFEEPSLWEDSVDTALDYFSSDEFLGL